MPNTTEEEVEEGTHRGSLINIAVWWRKFHFSGRVIVCSVLFGLGLILIGGLIFAINVNDDSSKSTEKETANHIPTKAPSNYIGPVVMGIGGFIVIVGVIMCLFETQVCRKRTGDSSPLISDKIEDPERKGAEPATEPSTSHGHKNHRHGARKTSSSPRKSKSRHAKSHSKERNQQKSPSPKSHTVSIEARKVFMTSSEDKFLTPPSSFVGHSASVKTDPRDSDDKNSSFMKSFTSSGPSWTQSSEFVTPATSFKDVSISLNNSVEVDKNPANRSPKITELSEKQFKNAEYLTPLTAEEDRIQQLLIKVKGQQKGMADSMKGTDDETSDNNLSSLQSSTEIVEDGTEMGKKSENENNSTNELSSEALHDASASNDAKREQPTERKDARELKQNENITIVSEEELKVVNNNEDLSEISDNVINTVEKNEPSMHENQEEEVYSVNDSATLPPQENKDHDSATLSTEENKDHDSATLPTEENKDHDSANLPTEENKDHDLATLPTEENNDHDSATLPTEENKDHDLATLPTQENKDHDSAPCSKEESSHRLIDENNVQVEYDSSVSSNETVVSHDSLQENHTNEKLSAAEGNSSDASKFLNTSESPDDVREKNDIDHQNTQRSILNEGAGERDLNLNKNDNMEKAEGMENLSKDVSS